MRPATPLHHPHCNRAFKPVQGAKAGSVPCAFLPSAVPPLYWGLAFQQPREGSTRAVATATHRICWWCTSTEINQLQSQRRAAGHVPHGVTLWMQVVWRVPLEGRQHATHSACVLRTPCSMIGRAIQPTLLELAATNQKLNTPAIRHL